MTLAHPAQHPRIQLLWVLQLQATLPSVVISVSQH